MKINSVVELENAAIKFEGELSADEANLVIEIGLNYLIRQGAFPAITEALERAQKEEEAAQGYEFPAPKEVQ